MSGTRPTDLDHELTRGFTARYARKKANSLIGLGEVTANDFEDMLQEFLLAVAVAVEDFDEERGHWRSFAATIIERRAAHLVRDRHNPRRTSGVPALSLEMLVADEDGVQVPLGNRIGDGEREAMTGRYAADLFSLVDLHEDVGALLETLPEELLELCRMLLTRSQREVADELGLTRRALRHRLDQIRAHLESARNP